VAQHPRVVGNGVRFRLRAAQRVCDAVAVGAAHRIDDFKRPVSIAFTPRVARRGDESAIELVIRDFVVEP
jgi:hypothetical protein